ncbi:hypothetical protein LIER_29580 [Lithospermum erythrorhizon]|uniref:Uncharacterized protein n=1 Tax=Lithospermum erythrorhizon TaxID=34254 RepID=A0AAV3RK43_LITER
MDDSSRFNLASPSHRLVGEFQFGLSPCSNNGSEHSAKVSQTSRVQQDADSTYTESEGNSSRQSDQISIVHVHHTESTDTGSVSGMLPGMHRNSDSHPRNHNFMITATPLNETCVGCVTTCRDVVIQGSSSLIVKDDVENSNVSFQGNTDEDIGSNKCMSSMKDYSVEEFSGTKIFQVGHGLGWSKVSPQRMCHNNDSSAGTNSSLEQDSEPSSINDVKAQPLHETNEEPPKFDSSVQRDAVSLVYFLVNGCSKVQDAVEETNRTENLKKERPQYSSESFASIVLKLPESNVDDYCVTSKQYELDDTNTRDCGIKLRRGSRRIKDFRKDVLPHLPSLSSKEIFEDMKIMQDALRSREYKRQRSKAQNEQCGSSHLKSRRPRCNRVARRRNT